MGSKFIPKTKNAKPPKVKKVEYKIEDDVKIYISKNTAESCMALLSATIKNGKKQKASALRLKPYTDLYAQLQAEIIAGTTPIEADEIPVVPNGLNVVN